MLPAEFLGFETLFDGVLMTARECGEHKLTSVWVSRVDGEIVAIDDAVDEGLDVREIETGVNALGVLIQGKSDDVDVSCTLSISE